MTFRRIAIAGAGAWGTALANAAVRAGCDVTLVARNAELAAAMAQSRRSEHMPDVALLDGITLTGEPTAYADADAIMLVVPAQAVREVAAALPPLKRGVPLIICAKGIEQSSHRFMSDVVRDVRPDAPVAVLSGPSFAADVGRGLPAAVTLAAEDETLAHGLAAALSSTMFRLYHSTDVRGVEIGGAAKNVLAIAAGIVTGKALGASAAAALTTRGFAELLRFARAYGARPETIMGLSGLGDLILTCSSTQSRNFTLGITLGRGAPSQNGKLAEGAFTASALVGLARAKQIDMPIASAVEAILVGTLSVDEATGMLLTRPIRAE